MKILLDTCNFLWLASDANELSNQARVLFQNMDNSIYLSSVSVWEIVVKNKIGKRPLPDAPEQFINEQCEKHFIESISLENKAIFFLTEFPNYTSRGHGCGIYSELIFDESKTLKRAHS